MTTPPTSTWRPAHSLDEIPQGGSRVWRVEGRQIALFRTDAETVYAVDNACPHEGYPLVQGYVKECVLTCAWHNFKFDLRDGACLKGDEAVASYPTRIREGRVEVELRELDPSADIPKHYASLEEGLLDNGLGRVARDAMRLLTAGEAPRAILQFAADFDAVRAEYGSNHALAVAADLATYLEELEGESQDDAGSHEWGPLEPIQFALEGASDPNVRRTPRARPAPEKDFDFGTAGPFESELHRRLEAEDLDGAEALLRGALGAGVALARVEAAFVDLATDHFLAFGHPLIYTSKAFELIADAPPDRVDRVLGALLFRFGNSTRHDTLPPWKPWRERMAALEGRWEAWSDPKRAEISPTPEDRAGLRAALLDGKAGEPFRALATALDGGWAPARVADALVEAAALRLLRFETDHDRDPTVQDGWLFVTHTFTFAHAVSRTLARHPRPRVLRLLFQAQRFIQGAAPLDRAPSKIESKPAPGLASTGGSDDEAGRDPIDSLLARVLAGDPHGAMARVGTCLHRDTPGLRRALVAHAIRRGGVQPIFQAHALKTTLAAFEAHDAMDAHWDREAPVRACVRFLAAPPQEMSLPQRTHEAARFVGHGEIPRVLSS